MPLSPARLAVRTALGWFSFLLVSCGSGSSSVQAAHTGEVLHHLFDHTPVLVEVGGDGISARLAAELINPTIWIRAETQGRDDWQIDMGAMDRTDGPMALLAFTELPVVGPTRRVRWDQANNPAAKPDPEAEPWDVLEIASDGIRTWSDGPGVYPKRRPYTYKARTEDLRARYLGSLPALDTWDPERLELQNQTKRSVPLPAPGRLAWRTQIPEGGSLRLAYGLREVLPIPVWRRGAGVRVRNSNEITDAPDSWASFRVGVRRENEAEYTTAWESRLSAGESGEFHNIRVDLSPWTGEFIELALISEDDGVLADHGYLPFVGEPILEAPDPKRPNVLMIVVDTLRADVLSCYGNPRPITPNIDTIAKLGVRYDDVMSAATWTLPSHVSLLTSLYPTEHGVQSKERMPEALQALPEVMREAGYSTHAVTEGIFLTPRYGLDQGFDHFEVGSWKVRNTFHAAKQVIKNQEGPWFLYLHTYQPHAPYGSEAPWRKRWVAPYDGPLELPIRNGDWTRLEGEPTAADIQFIHEMYEAEVAFVDDEIGKLLRYMRAEGLDDNLLIALTSDHGESFAEHGIWGHGTSAYQEQLQIPWILYQPGKFEGGLVIEDPVHSIDVAPTLLAAVDIPVPGDWSGIALDPFPGPDAADRLLFTGFLTQPWRRPATILRQGRYKHILFPAAQKDRTDASTARMTFDLVDDPGELNDLWQTAPGSDQPPFNLPEHLMPDLSILHQLHPPRYATQAAPADAAISAELETLGYAGEQD